MRVLVVDDSAAIRTRLLQMLREVCGPESVLEAESADEAIDVVARESIDVVVLDLHMPGKNGLAIIAELKGRATAPVVVVLTNHPNEHLRRECLVLGADFFFDKAREFDELIGVVLDRDGARSKHARATRELARP